MTSGLYPRGVADIVFLPQTLTRLTLHIYPVKHVYRLCRCAIYKWVAIVMPSMVSWEFFCAA